MPDAVVKAEPYAKWANRPYEVFGQTYTPILNEEAFVQRGVASWYGVKFHGQRTSSGEPYDMYAMTAAHPTLPIPSYVRVTNVATGKSVVVRVNDRGPFHASRVIDVSYTAALKLGLLGRGSHEVTVERLFAGDVPRFAGAGRPAPAKSNLRRRKSPR
ncbi:septal ring lytic transglycosylase RlpA family protein [Massilia sp. Dwa41.01b]|uniref:septal ring lytic transglycosylase RlpA family protein n=1 Tax=Massilia sp. Dwa41.01b TaxID=2709302 RepID=UPI0028064240|nr:septal ring lytic transglycosylase RlpA family protein [Massilia sp. Dwa41.01b]